MPRLFALILLCLAALPAWAGRLLPADALPGTVRDLDYPLVRIGDSVFRAAPGLRIYDTWNRTVLPGQLPVGIKVLFKTDLNGDLAAIWILSPEEVDAVEAAAR